MIKKVVFIIFSLSILCCNLVFAQTDKLNNYIERAFKYSNAGSYTTALSVWDLYLREVENIKGNDCLDYFLGVVYKSGVLIKAGRYDEAENLLTNAKHPSNESDLRINLAFLKNLASCSFHLNKYQDAIDLYGEAYNTLLEYKKYYHEETTENYHWCWSDELCDIVLQCAKVLIAKNDYINAEDILRTALGCIREDNEICVTYNGETIYAAYFYELFSIVSHIATAAMQNNDFNQANSYFDSLCEIATSFPDSGLIDWELAEYIVSETAKLDLDKAKQYAELYLTLIESTLNSWYGKVPGLTLEYIPNSISLNSTSIARAFENNNMQSEAEYFHLHAINVLESYNRENLELVDAHKYTNIAYFYQNLKGDYLQALRYHYKDFKLTSLLYPDNEEMIYNSFDRMLISYYLSFLKIEQLGVDGTLLQHYPEMQIGNLIYDDYCNIISEWRNIAGEIIETKGETYFDKLISYSDQLSKDMTYSQTGVTITTNIRHGSLSETYFYEVIAAICSDNIQDYQSAINKFRENVSSDNPEYIEYIEDICRTLVNRNYVQWGITLLAQEWVLATDKDDRKLVDAFNVMILNTSLNNNLNDIARHCYIELLSDSYTTLVPEYSTPEIYADKLLAISRGAISLWNDMDVMMKFSLLAEEVINNNNINFSNEKKGTIYRNIASYYSNNAESNKALEYQLKAVNQYASFSNHLEVGWPELVYKELADIYIDLNRYDEAIEILNRCVEHCLLPLEGVDRILSYVYSSLVSAYNGKEQYREMAEAARNMYLTRKAHFLDKSFGMQKANITDSYYGDTLPILLEWNSTLALRNPYMIELCYDVALSQKGFLLNHEIKLFNNVQSSNDDELVERYKVYKDAEKVQSDSLWFFEGRFLGRYSEHEEFKEKEGDITWQDVKDHLGPKDLAIEFTLCYKDDIASYSALLIKKDWDSPRMIELCSEDALKKIISTGAKLYQSNDVAYSHIWEKLEPYFSKGANIYFAPHGLIHQMNIEVLAGSDGKPMNKKCHLYRMSTTANIINSEKSSQYESATLYGGLNYDIDTTSLIALNRNYTKSLKANISLISDEMQTRSGWSYLPGTAKEVKNIETILGNGQIRTVSYTDTEGTEESFKALSGNSSQIIHIATHGFYLEDKNARKEGMFELAYTDNVQTISPLKRSGLIFSGGQHAWLGKEIPAGIEDGVLTAEEIAGMNLTGTDLLVLSACQTGLGEINNEGVAGLQRGFKIAGVNTIIMSLWEVSDAATEVLMTEFYELLTKGKSKRVAFDKAIEAVKNEYPSPEYWAAFIMLD